MQNINELSYSDRSLNKYFFYNIPFLAHPSRRLNVIYSDHSLFVRPSLTFSFKHHLLLNHITNFNKTPQECSFGGPISKLFKDLNSIQNFGCCGLRKGAKCPNFKNLPLNLFVRFQYYLVEMFLG